MKLTKISLVAVMAINAAFAGGDIAPVEPAVVVAPVVEAAACNSNTTINGKAQLYSYYKMILVLIAFLIQRLTPLGLP